MSIGRGSSEGAGAEDSLGTRPGSHPSSGLIGRLVLILGLTLSFGATNPSLSSASAPTVTTELATAIAQNTATLNAVVDPNGIATAYWFEYTDEADFKANGYANAISVPSPPQSIGSGSQVVEVDEAIGGLEPRTRYRFRVVASGSAGSSYGDDERFTTQITTPTYQSAFGSQGSGDGQLKYASDVAVDPTDGTTWVADQGNNRIQHFSAAGQYLGKFASCADPGSVAVDSQGDLYVACSMIDKVQKLDDEGALLDNLTTSGTGNGQVRFPLDLALDGEDNLWIADNENARVQKLDPDGDFLLAFPVGGSGRPWGIDVAPDGNVWTAERNSHRVSVFEKDGDLLFRAGTWGSGDGQLKYPADVEVDENGNAWVADAGNDRVQVFSPQGGYVTQFGEEGSGAGQFDTEWWLRIALGEDDVAWVLDEGNSRVTRWEALGLNPTYQSAFGSQGSGDGQLKYASDVAVDPTDGTTWVADQGNNPIQHFSAAGQYLGKFASCADPGSVAVDSQGDLYVACSMIDKVQKLDDEGALLDNLTTSGTGNGQVRFPLDLALDGEDNLWIADNENARVQKLDPDGDFLLAFPVGGSGRPWGIDVAPDGNVWTAERNSHRVSVFEKDGDLLFRAGTWGSGDGQLKYPADVEVDENGNAWVADAGNDRVQVFSPQGGYVTQFGEEGSGAGQFDTEWWLRIALGEDGDAWILTRAIIG